MTSSLDGVQLHYVNNFEKLGELHQWMAQPRSVLAVDTETEGLQWWRHKPRMIQVGDARAGWAVPWDLWGGAVLEALDSYAGPIVMHNAGFDVKMMEQWCGYTFPRHRIHDTRVLAHLLEPHKPTGLKAVAARYIDGKAVRAQRALDEAMWNNKWTWATVPLDFELYWAYAGLDTVLTAQLFDILYPKVMAETPAAYDLEMALAWIIIKMELKGVAIDVEYTQEKLTDFQRYIEQSEAWVLENFGIKPGSNQAVIERLQRDTDYSFSKTTPKGALSLDKDVLPDVAAATGHPLATVVLERRRMQKMVSSYLKTFLELEHEGRVHPSYNQLKTEYSKYGARTGRESISEPPFQQLPRKNANRPAAIAVRNCVTASAGNVLLMSDFDQIEARGLAHLCQDPGLLAAFDEGDFFVNIARQLYGDPTIVKSDPRRTPTKNATYAKIYCAGVEKFAKTAGIPIEQAHAVFNALSANFPGIDSFIAHVIRVGEQRYRETGLAFVRSPLSGRRHIADLDKIYALVNYLIQGLAAEIFKMKKVEIDHAGMGDLLVLAVHDEVMLDVPKEDTTDVGHAVQGIMNDDQLLSVPITAGLDMAERWGEK